MGKAKAPIYGNMSTAVYHDALKPNDACRKAEIKKSNLIDFESAAEAESQGFKPCQICRKRTQEDEIIDAVNEG